MRTGGPLEAIVAGALQGLLEWFPVSSSGQLMLFLMNLAGLGAKLAFEVGAAAHLGTALAAIVVMREEVVEALKSFLRGGALGRRLAEAVLASFVVGGPLFLLADRLLGKLSLEMVNALIGLLLVITGAVMMAARRTRGCHQRVLGRREAWALGALQGLAALPGLSRSGVTVAFLLMLGLQPSEALGISFLIGIPATAAAGVAGVVEGGLALSGVLCALAAFIIGALSLKALLKLAAKLDLSKFMIVYGLVAALALPLAGRVGG